MSEGWKNAIEFIYEKEVSILLGTIIKRKNGQDAGDIDVAFEFKYKKSIQTIFPSKCVYRPDIHNKDYRAQFFLAEVKRSCNMKDKLKHIKQFVAFYSLLLGKNRYKRTKFAEIPASIQRAIESKDTILIFVFNSADSVTVYKQMQEEIQNFTGDKDGKIMGRRVICVWCSSSELISWETILSKDKIIEEKNAIIEDLKKQLAKK